jgi:predicted glycogen debranching enzyme
VKAPSNLTQEWLEADGLGGFASGTVPGIRTRRYHALLLAAAGPSCRRFVLVNGLEVEAETPSGLFPLSSHAYSPDVIHPDGASRIASFTREPWPRWEYRIGEEGILIQEILVPRGAPLALISWRLAWRTSTGPLLLRARPLISGRDFHSLHRENPAFRFGFDRTPQGGIRWHPYDGVPAIVALGNGSYEQRPDWYRRFLYAEERDRGLECQEDLASPGIFHWDLSRGEAFLALGAEGAELEEHLGAAGTLSPDRTRERERRRRSRFPGPLHRAADAYRVRNGGGETLLAGYPWFGEWGRDTFLALRGLCLAAGEPEQAGGILVEWAGRVSEGMIPNRFSEGAPEYNSVDASLWFVIAVHDYFEAMSQSQKPVRRRDLDALRNAVEAVLEGYAAGTRNGIRADDDGLLAAGAPGEQLTWMDAMVDGAPVTPRIGKPVEVQALWLNALWTAAGESPRFKELLRRGYLSFQDKFWNEKGGYFHDVVDVDHVAGRNDSTFRPNQILAVGGLPRGLVAGERARRVVDLVEERLLTPLGLRSLAPGERGYAPRYQGGVAERDGAYHQGTVWPWLLGPFVDAWLKVRGHTGKAKREARSRFLDPILKHLDEAGLGHVSEIADADAPHIPRGCPFQAWSVGEALRISVMLTEAVRPAAGATRKMTENRVDPGPAPQRETGRPGLRAPKGQAS